MMYQLWDLHPNFISDWVDSSSIAEMVPFATWKEYGDRGIIGVPQQILLNLNALLIIALVVPLSWVVRHMRTLSAMLIGMTVATGGVLVAGLTGNGWVLLLGVVLFSLGEMLTGPKKNEYLSLIAPPGKKALYLGYVNIPIGLGVGIGSLMAGFLYDEHGEKATLAMRYMVENPKLIPRAARSVDWSDSLDLLPELLDIERDDAFDVAQQELGLPRDAAAAHLVRMFRHDRGQITNLAMEWLKRNPVEDQGKFKRGEAFDIVRDRVMQERDGDEAIEDTSIEAMLWDDVGGDDATLDNLALEYLAQGTLRLETAVAGMDFSEQPTRTQSDSPESAVEAEAPSPRERLKKELGIDRTKAFLALSSSIGANDAATTAALDGLTATIADDDRAYVYLMNQRHRRFTAIARKDWKKDVALLDEMLESQAEVKALAVKEIDNVSSYWRFKNGILNVFGVGEDTTAPLSERLAGRSGLIQEALDHMEWSKSPQHAAALLGMNPYEARAAVSTEVNRSAVTATRTLWNTFNPQYKVWIPFAVIGFISAIALAIFGKMAKRWADMDA